jgi:YVTN family beta-propeller protein
VIDGAADSVITAVPAGAAFYVHYNTLNNKVYCAVSTGDDVAVIDGATDSLLRTISVGDHPWDMVHNPQQNRMYVVNYLDSSVSVLRDSMTGIEENTRPPSARHELEPTIVRGVLRLPASPFTIHSSLFDMTGRQVMDLGPGQNDIRHLSPGVYFVSESHGERLPAGVRRVVVLK